MSLAFCGVDAVRQEHQMGRRLLADDGNKDACCINGIYVVGHGNDNKVGHRIENGEVVVVEVARTIDDNDTIFLTQLLQVRFQLVCVERVEFNDFPGSLLLRIRFEFSLAMSRKRRLKVGIHSNSRQSFLS